MLPGALTGSGGTLAPPAADGAAVPVFALPASCLSGLGGGGASLSVQVTGAGARPAGPPLLSLASLCQSTSARAGCLGSVPYW